MTELRRIMLEDLRLGNYSPNTIEVYIRCVARFAQHLEPHRIGSAPNTSGSTSSSSSSRRESPGRSSTRPCARGSLPDNQRILDHSPPTLKLSLIKGDVKRLEIIVGIGYAEFPCAPNGLRRGHQRRPWWWSRQAGIRRPENHYRPPVGRLAGRSVLRRYLAPTGCAWAPTDGFT